MKKRYVLIALPLLILAVAIGLSSFSGSAVAQVGSYEYTLNGGKVVVGDRDREGFWPTARLSRWDGECSIKVAWPTARVILPTIEGSKLEWRDTDVELHFYPLVPTETRYEGGGFEVELLLKERPAGNQFSFMIETEGLEFYHQPELAKEEVDAGCIRPPDIVGSYAVYHSTRGNSHASIADAERYRAGKAFHIYRPKAHDAEGRTTWGELLIEGNQLTITVDQQWLDEAVYPVVIDPTFGYESKGSSSHSTASNVIWGTQFTCPESGTVDSMTAYLYGNAASSVAVEFGLYEATSPYEHTGHTQEGSITSGYDDWMTLNADGNIDLTAQDYLLCIWPAGPVATIYYDTGASSYYDPESYDGIWPANHAHNAWGGQKLSVYCTYSTGAPPPAKYHSFMY